MTSGGPCALLTGAGGLAGRYLHRELQGAGWRVVATGPRAGEGLKRLDVTDAADAERALQETRPAAVVHLAARTYLPRVWEEPGEACLVNVVGTLNVLEAVRRQVPGARVLLASSCMVYGDPDPGELPLDEGRPLRGVHPYAVQKTAVELLGRRAREGGLDVVVVRPFNHVGPGMAAHISLMHFALQIARAEQGEGPPELAVGNLEAARDFLDARDVASAYRLLLEHPGPPPVLNVASGTSRTLAEALAAVRAMARVPTRVRRDPARYRELDVKDLRGDAGLLRRTTGWEPRITWERTLADILEDARGRAGRAWA